MPTHQLHQVRLHTAHAQHSFLLALHVPLAHLLATHQHETALACLQQTVVFALVRLVLLHYQLEVAVVQQKRALFLHEQQVSEGMHEGDSDVELRNFLQPVLGACVDLIHCKLLSAQSEQLVATAELHLQNVSA